MDGSLEMFLLVATIIFGLGTLYNFFAVYWLRFHLRCRPPIRVQHGDSGTLTLDIFIPVRDEQDAIAASTHYFANWATFASTLINVCVTYVSAIDRDSGRVMSTQEVTAQAMKHQSALLEKPVLYHVHYPFAPASKAAQINWAIRQHSNSAVQNPKARLIGIYDVDARPPLNTVAALLEEVPTSGQWPELLQQLTVYYSAAGRTPYSTLWGQIAALWQTRFSYLVEALVLSLKGRSRGGVLRWMIGNGLFIRGDVFEQMDGFSSEHPIEDIEFGFRVSLAGLPIVVLPIFLESGNPASFFEDVRQKSRWFSGLWHYPRYANDGVRAQPVKSVGFAVQGIVRGLAWLTFGPLIFVTALIALFNAESTWFSVMGLSGFIYVWTAAALTLIITRGREEAVITRSQLRNLHQNCLIVLLSPLYAIAFCLGPLMQIQELVSRYLGSMSWIRGDT